MFDAIERRISTDPTAAGGVLDLTEVVRLADLDGGRPADIAAAVRYLAGPDAGYVTGQILSVNGGVVFGR